MPDKSENDESINSFKLKYSHHIIEHLGLRLYQNKPTNVLAELVSNSWDACAENVRISMDGAHPNIIVVDDGIGMTAAHFKNNYLVIGNKRRENDPSARITANGKSRYQMGRKGIGKLAPFGIAREVQVLTIAPVPAGTLEITWISLDLDAIFENDLSESNTYEPAIIEAGVFDSWEVIASKHGGASKFLDECKAGFSKTGTGTGLLLGKLSIQREIPLSQLKKSLAARFSILLLEPDFKVEINKVEIDRASALPSFAFEIGQFDNMNTHQIKVGEKSLNLKYWIGFLDTAEWSAEQSGVGIYAHGKIAQDRPFFFGLKGGEIFTRYMYGMVVADWIDEQTQDLISTDRTSIDWNHPSAVALQEWGGAAIRSWVKDYKAWRKKKNEKEVIDKEKTNLGDINLRDSETQALAGLVQDMFAEQPQLEEKAAEVIQSLAKAWVHEPSRKLVKETWEAMNRVPPGEAGAFHTVVEKIVEHNVPDGLSLAVVFAERAYALERLATYHLKGTECDMQTLVTKFPWLVYPSAENISANERLQTAIDVAVKEGKFTVASNGASVPSDRPDFVFLSTSSQSEIIVVELKHPQIPLSLENLHQLQDYMRVFQRSFATATLKGLLIGNTLSTIPNTDKAIEIIDWQSLLDRNIRENIDLLLAFFVGHDVSRSDPRVEQIRNLSGPKVRRTFELIAQNHPDLRGLIEKFENTGSKHPAKKDSIPGLNSLSTRQNIIPS